MKPKGLSALALMGVCTHAVAASAQASPAPAAPAASSPALQVSETTLPKGTLVPVELTAAVSSERAVDGDRFPIRAFEPVVVNGKTILPMGTMGEGEVIHAAKSQRQGMPGELIVAARFLLCGTTQIRLGHLQFSNSGRDRTMAWIIERSILRYPAAVKGAASELPAGTRGIATVLADTSLPNENTCVQSTTELQKVPSR